MKVMPFFSIYYKGDIVPRESQSLCGEFGGDCFKFVSKFLKLQWIDMVVKNNKDWLNSKLHEKVHNSHICTPAEITEKHYKVGNLFICPPKDKLRLKGNYISFQSRVIGFQASPASDEPEMIKKLNNFGMRESNSTK